MAITGGAVLRSQNSWQVCLITILKALHLSSQCKPGISSQVIVQVLKAQFPGTALMPDVAAVQQLPEDTEVVAAGFPCIDVSRAGLRRGVHNGAVRTCTLLAMSFSSLCCKYCELS